MSKSRWEGWKDVPSTGGSINVSKDGKESFYSPKLSSDKDGCNDNHMHFWSDGNYSQKTDGRNAGGINEDVSTAVTAFLGSTQSSDSESSSNDSSPSDSDSFNLFDPSTW